MDNKIKVGSTIRLINDLSLYATYNDWLNQDELKTWAAGDRNPPIGDLYTVNRIAPHGEHPRTLGFCVNQNTGKGYIIGIDDVRTVRFHCDPVKTPTKLKPKITYKASGRRQFDVTLKLNVVRKAAAIRRSENPHGRIRKLLKEYNIVPSTLFYWEKQHKQGHFSSERAIAFSRKDTMIHG